MSHTFRVQNTPSVYFGFVMSDFGNAYGATRFSKDGKGVFLTFDEDTEFRSLNYYDLTTHKMSKIVTLNGDIGQMALSYDGAKLAFIHDEGGYSKLYLMDAKTMKYAPLGIVEKGVMGGIRFNRDNNRLALTMLTSFQARRAIEQIYVGQNMAMNVTLKWQNISKKSVL